MNTLIKIRSIADTLEISSQSFIQRFNALTKANFVGKVDIISHNLFLSKEANLTLNHLSLCDFTTNYILDFIIYIVKNTDTVCNLTIIGQSTNVVMTLLRLYPSLYLYNI